MNYYEKRYYTVYHASEDKTFIMCDTLKNDDVVSVEVCGFHFGEPYSGSFSFIGRSIATFLE